MYSSYERFLRKKISENRKKKFRKNFHDFFFNFFASKIFGFRFFSSSNFFFGNILSIFFYNSARGGERSESSGVVGERSERRGGVGERSEPPAGGLAVGAEGSVNSEL